jgi:FixJ family two-component response regulator
MDGLELARSVKASWPEIAVVVMSGRRLPRPSELPENTHFLSKPFSEQRLVDVLADAVEPS